MKFKDLKEMTTSDGTGTDNFIFHRFFNSVMRRPNLDNNDTFYTDINLEKKRSKKWRKKNARQ